ncbi:class I SAM-dependent methyltransferase, partial [Aquisalimonas sp.]|uniref:class I SAM-dependent methyltransferase n=1 Tax=Aquisalimonas sp. TaxID=1872621 RepID=UPI0025BC964A
MAEKSTTNLPRAHQSANGLDRLVNDLLSKADIRINGNRPWDIQLHAPDVPERALAYGNLGLGEAYMDGHWDAERLDEFFFRVLRARIHDQVQPLRLVFHSLRARLLNLQSLRRAKQVGEAHYDLGNDFYAAMLDARMTYTCGYW